MRLRFWKPRYVMTESDKRFEMFVAGVFGGRPPRKVIRAIRNGELPVFRPSSFTASPKP